MHLKLTPGRDVLVPPFVPTAQVLANPTPVARRPLLAFFSGSVAHAEVRQQLLAAVADSPDVSVFRSSLKMRQEGDTTSQHAQEVAEVIRATLAEMDRAR